MSSQPVFACDLSALTDEQCHCHHAEGMKEFIYAEFLS